MSEKRFSKFVDKIIVGERTLTIEDVVLLLNEIDKMVITGDRIDGKFHIGRLIIDILLKGLDDE